MFRINIQIILLSIVNIIFLFGIHKSEILYVTKASNVTISCPFTSVKNSLQWSGPPNLTLYSDNLIVNPAVKDVGIIRSGANGVFILIIYGFNESNEGEYQCTTLKEGKPVMHDVDVMLQLKSRKTVKDNSSSNNFSYSFVYITACIGLLLATITSVGYLWYKSDILKKRNEHRENRNSGQQEVNVAFNNMYGINENRQPTVHGAASASVVYSNLSQNENDEALRTDQLPCRPSTRHVMPLNQQLVKQNPLELNYIEIDLDPVPQDRQFYIHGNDNRTEYSEIEIGVIGDPLQFSESETDDDNDTIDCVAINP